MAYAPGIAYHGDQYLYQAISGLGDDFSKALEERRKIEQTDAYNDMIMQAARQRGEVSEDDLNKYLQASHSQKTGIAAAHAANIAEDWKRKLQLTQIAENQAQTAAANAHAEAYRQQAQNRGMGFTPQVTTLNDPATGKQFSVYSRGPNQVDLTPGSQDGGHPMAGQTVYHPETDEAIGMYDNNGNPKYFPRQGTVDPVKAEMAKMISGGSASPQDDGKPAAAGGKPLDAATARQILQQVGGDKDKARALARQLGYTF